VLICVVAIPDVRKFIFGFKQTAWMFRGLSPWSPNSIEKGDNGWNVDVTPHWYLNLRNKDCGWDNKAVKHRGQNVADDLAHEKEVVDDIDSLPKRHSLHQYQ
jgi:hypothetical protein